MYNCITLSKEPPPSQNRHGSSHCFLHKQIWESLPRLETNSLDENLGSMILVPITIGHSLDNMVKSWNAELPSAWGLVINPSIGFFIPIMLFFPCLLDGLNGGYHLSHLAWPRHISTIRVWHIQQASCERKVPPNPMDYHHFPYSDAKLILGYTSYHSQTEPNHISGWWFGTWLFWLSIYWEWNNYPNWLIFFRGVGLNHQPDICWLYIPLYPDSIPLKSMKSPCFMVKSSIFSTQNWPKTGPGWLGWWRAEATS